VEAGLGVGGEALRPSPAIGGDGSARQSFADLALSLAIGKEFGPYASVLGMPTSDWGARDTPAAALLGPRGWST
jgi:hypothetical protein